MRMLEENDYRKIRAIRQQERKEILNALNISEEKQIFDLGHKNQNNFQNTVLTRRRIKSSQFPVMKKWCSPRRNSTNVLKSNNDDLSRNSEENKSKEKRPNSYGAIEGIEVGTCWDTRLDCSYAGVHRPTVAGIHPGKDGAYSVALSGNYEDDQDNGYCFTYTGSGGRDLRGTKYNRKNLRIAPQSKNQTADGPNRSLIRSVETRNPVRVIRGFKLNSPFATDKGYRYDGLYTVENFWTCRGISGFLIYKFFMKRCENQKPVPWEPGFERFETRRSMRTRKSPDSKSNENNGNLIENVQEIINSSNKTNNLVETDVLSNGESSPGKFMSSFKTKICSQQDFLSEEATSSKSNHDDNKENNTINVTDNWFNGENFTGSENISMSSNTALSNLPNDAYLSNSFQSKHSLPERHSGGSKFAQANENNVKLWVKQIFTKLDENTAKKNVRTNESIRENENVLLNNKVEESSDVFRGFNTEHRPNKLVLLGFLIHEMENKLFQK